MNTDNKKKMGLWMSTSLVIGNMIGAGIFLMPSALAAYGGISIIGWIFSAAGAILLAKIFSNLSVLVPNKSGGPYIYSKIGFGDFAAFLVAWGYWISIWVANAAIAIAFVGALSVFLPILEENKVWAVVVGLGAIWFLTWINSRGVRASGKMQLITTTLKLVPLVLIIIGGFFFFNWDHFSPFNLSGASTFSAISITAAMTLYAYMGVESATIPAVSIENPEKNIPKATMIGTIITAMVYILSTVMIMGMIPPDALSKSPAPFADAMEIISGEWGKDMVAFGAAIAAFGALNGWILVQGQIAMSIAKDNLFPTLFKKENKNGVPIMGLVVGSILTSIVMLMNYTDGLVDQFKFLILLTALCVLIPYLFSSAAYVLIKMQRKNGATKWIPIIALGGLAFAYSLWAVYGAGEKAVFWGFLLLLAGIPLYVWMKRR
ncbi:amino acid permease [Maribacter halichondriae]|uniref:amino acid permease n=1 Tax=Maribacter halichondriae TaxID=2980554 RepID=UPI002359BA94|nr:amino acid permease [Maribacter sp. Hal144]